MRCTSRLGRRRWGAAAGGFVLLVLAFAPIGPIRQADAAVRYVCVNDRTGESRAVRDPRSCRAGETARKAGFTKESLPPKEPAADAPKEPAADAPEETASENPETPVADDRALGEACSAGASCGSGYCVDGRCCDGPCTGACRACDLAGMWGSCVPIPSGADPDQECAPFSCDAFYAGFAGDTCRRRAEVDSVCSGAGSCRSPSELCPLAPAGEVARVCAPGCQPVAGTCVGTTPGICANDAGQCAP